MTAPPYYVRTDDTHGGSCNLTPCTGSASVGRYMLPTEMITDLRAAGPDQWVVLSTYKQLTGAKLSGSRRWDCTSGDPRKHWTSEVESYCLKDLLAALDAIKPGSVVTDPATVGEAWGRRPGSPPPTTTTTMPGGTDVANPNTTLSAPRSGTASRLARGGDRQRLRQPRGGGRPRRDTQRGDGLVAADEQHQLGSVSNAERRPRNVRDDDDRVVVERGATQRVVWPVSAAVDTAGKSDSTDAWVIFTVG